MDFLSLFCAFCTAHILNGFGIRVVREGVRIASADGGFCHEIISECSGVNSITALALTTVLHGILYVKNTRRIFFLTACSVPVAFGVNVLRTVCVALVAWRFGEPASHIFHQASGFLTFPLAIAIMFLLAKK